MTIEVTPIEAVIASGATGLSSAIKLSKGRLFGIQMPSTWVAASLTFQANYDGGTTFYNLYDSSGNEITYTVAASRFVLMTDPFQLLGIQYLKIRSGTSGVPVDQTADRTLGLAVCT